jgi:hypothetical protein
MLKARVRDTQHQKFISCNTKKRQRRIITVVYRFQKFAVMLEINQQPDVYM